MDRLRWGFGGGRQPLGALPAPVTPAGVTGGGSLRAAPHLPPPMTKGTSLPCGTLDHRGDVGSPLWTPHQQGLETCLSTWTEPCTNVWPFDRQLGERPCCPSRRGGEFGSPPSHTLLSLAGALPNRKVGFLGRGGKVGFFISVVG